jgi:hypothetical protein
MNATQEMAGKSRRPSLVLPKCPEEIHSKSLLQYSRPCPPTRQEKRLHKSKTHTHDCCPGPDSLFGSRGSHCVPKRHGGLTQEPSFTLGLQVHKNTKSLGKSRFQYLHSHYFGGSDGSLDVHWKTPGSGRASLTLGLVMACLAQDVLGRTQACAMVTQLAACGPPRPCGRPPAGDSGDHHLVPLLSAGARNSSWYTTQKELQLRARRPHLCLPSNLSPS